MNRFRSLLGTTALLWINTIQAAPTVEEAAAEPNGPAGSGFYVGAGYAIVYSPDETLDVTSSNSALSAVVDYDLGFQATSLSAGYSFANGLRAELEAGYRRNELELIEFSDSRGALNTGAEDAVDAVTGFANLYYEFQPNVAIRPYIGAGVGLASVSYTGNFSVLENFSRSDSPLFDDHDSAFAWQVMAGASFAFSRRTRLAAEYRYWQTDSLSFSSNDSALPSTYRTRHKLHMAGIQLQFFPDGVGSKPYAPTQASRLAKREHSERAKGLYAATRFGVAAAVDTDIEDNSIDTNFDAFDLGAAGGLAIGYQWRSKRGWPLRVELEASRFSNEADVVDFGPLAGEYPLRGDTRTTAVAINLLAERRRRPGLYPYAGIGIGYAKVDYDVQVRKPQTPGMRNQPFLDSSATSPTAQVLLGLRATLGARLSMSLGYRYWIAPTLKPRNPAGERIETEHCAHMIQLGMQWLPR